MRYCGWWFQLKFIVALYLDRIRAIFRVKCDQQNESQANAAYNDKTFTKEY